MTIEVRRARTADVDRVVCLVNKLLAEIGGTPVPLTVAGDVLGRIVSGASPGVVIVGEVDGEIVGACTMSYQDAMRTRGRYAIIQEMYVAPDHRSTGVGGAVVEAAVREAASAGCSQIELGAYPGDDRQLAFYSRLGFKGIGPRLRRRLEAIALGGV